MSRYLTVPHFSTLDFCHEPKTKSIHTEASTICFETGQLYSDACDIGLALVSHKTSEVLHWYVEKQHVNDELEITHWTLRPCPYDLMREKFKHMVGYVMTVWND